MNVSAGMTNDHPPDMTASDMRHGLHLFTDGSYDPKSGNGGWGFAAYRDGTEIALASGGVRNAANNAMETMAVLEAARWINANAAGEPAIIWSDSVHTVKGCNDWRPIWKNNGWKKIGANPNLRTRTIADRTIWQAIDRELESNPALSVIWCKGHAGIGGNERADELADQGRLAVGMGAV